jgi:hypothetical protein
VGEPVGQRQIRLDIDGAVRVPLDTVQGRFIALIKIVLVRGYSSKLRMDWD